MLWKTYICSEKQPDLPFEATKDGITYYWTIAVELPSYSVVEWTTVLTLAQAEQHWISKGYALPDPPEMM